jgi:Tfp pilus assembly protein PilX
MKKLDQKGAVAMISVVIFALIITILATAYARTIVNQQREATNYDLSTRAFYAAEAGAQDAIRAIKAATPTDKLVVKGQSECKESSTYLGGSTTGYLDNSSSDLAFTCQLVDISTSDGVSGKTDRNSGLWRISPGGSAPANGYELTVTWRPAVQTGSQYAVREDGSKLFPPLTVWGQSQFPPVLRLSLISNSSPGAPSRASLKQHVYFLNPAANAEPSEETINPESAEDASKIVRNASCTTSQSEGYECSISFNAPASLFSGKELYAVVHSVYGESNYKISMTKKGSAEPVDLKGIATIDVTARAGNVFKRIKQQISLDKSYRTSWFDASGLVVGDGICKLFSVGKTESQFNPQCNPKELSTP